MPDASADRGFTPAEMMTVAAARLLGNDSVCFVGIGLPSTAANLARLTHAPEVTLIYESGPIGAKPSVLPLSIGDGELATTADTVVSTPEIFRYWLQGGRITTGFLGGAQIDRFANLNTTVIGPYDRPKVRLPGAGGAPEIAAQAHEVLIIMQQSPRSFVDRLEFVTTAGFLDGGDARERAGMTTRGPSHVITDHGILQPDPESRELTLTHLHPGVTVEQTKKATGWELKVAEDLAETPAPQADTLAVLRDLHARTKAAHAGDQAGGGGA
jgi:glutaconate CoA-transferase subunit B